jgi:hypothetical protein
MAIQSKDHKQKPNVWFVSQGTTFNENQGMKFLWAPQKNKAGNPVFHWENVMKVRKGDLIFHNSKGVRGVSIAITDGYQSKNPQLGNQWGSAGYRVDVDLTLLKPIISSQTLRDNNTEFHRLLKSVQKKPFTRNGRINQGYLYEFTLEAGLFIRELYGKKFNNKIIDSLIDDLKTSTKKPETVEKSPAKETKAKIKYILNYVHQFISSKGFRFSYEEVANFYLSQKTKPFVILAGISGTGKTQLPRMFAKALGMKENQVIQIPVRPDWTDGSDLLGYTGLDEEFKPKELTLAILEARKVPEKPYFFILDEMNLARVEHYFSDFLSIIETRRWSNNKIVTDPILRKEALDKAKNAERFSDLRWPENLYLIGTVNMDETTHAFSRKVLDRANSIEMNEVNLDWLENSRKTVEPYNGVDNTFFGTKFLGSIDLTIEQKNSIRAEIDLLKEVNEILKIADLHFAYRVRDEVAFYLILNQEYGLMDPKVAMDFQLVQKVLPRIHGSSERVQTVLLKLFNLLEGTDFRTDSFEYDQLEEKISEETLKYPRASKKIKFMLKRYEDDRFTSFWL